MDLEQIKIRLLECHYDSVVVRVEHPVWDAIRDAIRSLISRTGRIDLWEDKENGAVVMISGSPGVYALDVIIDDSRAAMMISKRRQNVEVIEVFGEEYRSDQTTEDFDELATIVEKLLAEREFVETASMSWEFRQLQYFGQRNSCERS